MPPLISVAPQSSFTPTSLKVSTATPPVTTPSKPLPIAPPNPQRELKVETVEDTPEQKKREAFADEIVRAQNMYASGKGGLSDDDILNAIINQNSDVSFDDSHAAGVGNNGINNPLGIKYIGQAGAKAGTISPEGGAYAHFDSPQAALADFKRILGVYKGMTLSQYITKYKGVGNASSYIQDAVNNLGVNPNTPIDQIDPAKMLAFQAKHETNTKVNLGSSSDTGKRIVDQINAAKKAGLSSAEILAAMVAQNKSPNQQTLKVESEGGGEGEPPLSFKEATGKAGNSLVEGILNPILKGIATTVRTGQATPDIAKVAYGLLTNNNQLVNQSARNAEQIMETPVGNQNVPTAAGDSIGGNLKTAAIAGTEALGARSLGGASASEGLLSKFNPLKLNPLQSGLTTPQIIQRLIALDGIYQSAKYVAGHASKGNVGSAARGLIHLIGE